MLRSCTQCGNLEDDESAVSCSVCDGALVAPKVAITQPHSKGKARKQQKGIRPVPVLVTVLLIFIPLLLANMHIVRGSTYHGPLFVERLSAGFSEMFINTDELLNMPLIGAKSRYPLGVAALQRIGFLESEQQRDERIKQETDALFNKASDLSERSAEDQLYKLKHGRYPEE